MGEVIAGQSTVGGGSLPGETLPTCLLSFKVATPERLMERLRNASPAVIARVQDEMVVLDPRTVFADQEPTLLNHIKDALAGMNP
jgi:L-seryl-tRNA(Ser) seleniumtransferase